MTTDPVNVTAQRQPAGPQSADSPSRQTDAPERHPEIPTLTLRALLLLASIYALWSASAFLIPVTVALLLFLVLWPVLRLLVRMRIPQSIASALIVAVLVSGFAAGFYTLSGPAAHWVSELPTIIDTVQLRLKGPVTQMQAARDKVEEAIASESGGPQEKRAAKPAANKRTRPKENKSQPSPIGLVDIVTSVISSLGSFGGSLVIIFSMLYFMLANGDQYREKIVRVLPTLHDKKRALGIIRRIQQDLAHYLLLITIINLVLGCFIGLGLYLVDMPNPMLWGAMAAALNFVPYIGALLGQIIVGIVGLVAFPDPVDAWQPVAVYLALSVIEGQFVTPSILGRRLTINPLIVFLAVLFWGWIWGIVGALLAVPLLACFKTICDSVERLHPVGEFLER
jgi:predicted PurR-regulated permease PerM